jgi:uncharacterized protein DUF6265
MSMLMLTAVLTLHDVGWLAGDWQLTRGDACVEEHWTLPSDSSLIGMSRTVTRGRTAEFEFLRIEPRGDGIYYVAQPGGRPPVAFKLASDSARELVFVNPGHADHLKHIVYRRGDDDDMTARIEGEDAGRPFAIDFRYRRAPNSAASRCGAVK